MEAAWQAGRSAFPSVPLGLERFAARLRAVRGPGLPPPRPGDFFLAQACAEGLPEAWTLVREGLLPRVRAFLVSRGASAAEADAVTDGLPSHLWEGPGEEAGAGGRIGGFRGDSALVTWLAVVARRNLGRLRGERDALPGPARTPSGLPDPSATPLSAAIGRERALRLEGALSGAWSTLTPRERLAVLLKFRDGLPQKEIARLMDVGEPRVSRLIEGGLERLREEIGLRSRETPPGSRESDASAWDALREAVVREMARTGEEAL